MGKQTLERGSLCVDLRPGADAQKGGNALALLCSALKFVDCVRGEHSNQSAKSGSGKIAILQTDYNEKQTENNYCYLRKHRYPPRFAAGRFGSVPADHINYWPTTGDGH